MKMHISLMMCIYMSRQIKKTLNAAYGDVLKVLETPVENLEELTGFRGISYALVRNPADIY